MSANNNKNNSAIGFFISAGLALVSGGISVLVLALEREALSTLILVAGLGAAGLFCSYGSAVLWACCRQNVLCEKLKKLKENAAEGDANV